MLMIGGKYCSLRRKKYTNRIDFKTRVINELWKKKRKIHISIDTNNHWPTEDSETITIYAKQGRASV